MKSQLAKFLSAIVFALAIGSAFANSTVAPGGAVTKKWVNNSWQTIPANEHYHCEPAEIDCVAQFNGSTMVPGSLVRGVYTIIP